MYCGTDLVKKKNMLQSCTNTISIGTTAVHENPCSGTNTQFPVKHVMWYQFNSKKTHVVALYKFH